MNNSSNSGGGEGGEQQQLSAAAGNNGGGGVSSPPPSNASPSSSMAVVVVVRATHEYCPVNNDELHIRVGDLITVTNMEEGGWWEGTSSATGTVGWFPSNYVVLVEEGTQQQQQLNHQQQQQQNVVVSTRDNVSGGGNITKHEEYRNEIVAEMVESEAAFITEMESFLERGVKRMIGMVGGNSLGGSPQDPQVLQTLSTCFTMLIAAHKKHVLGELAPLSSGNQTTSSPQTQQITTTSSGSPSSQQQPPRVVGSVRVGRVFLTAAPHLESAHTRYCALHPRVVQFVERNQEVLASSFAGEARDNSGVLKIITSLSAPFRRVERYARVLHEVERHVEEYHWDRGDLQRGVLYYRDLAKTLTDLRKQKEMELEVLTPGAIKDYEGTDITSLGDIILMKLVFVGRDRQPRYFVLFPNTIVILAYDNTDNTLTYKGRVLVSGVTVNPITDGQVLLVQTHQNHNNNQLLDEDNNGNNNNNNGLITNAFEISGPTLHPILVQCPTPKDKVTWLHHLNELLRVTRCFSSSSSGMMMMNNNGSGVVGNVNAATTQPHHQQQQQQQSGAVSSIISSSLPLRSSSNNNSNFTALSPPVQAWNITRLRVSPPFNPFLMEQQRGGGKGSSSSSTSLSFSGLHGRSWSSSSTSAAATNNNNNNTTSSSLLSPFHVGGSGSSSYNNKSKSGSFSGMTFHGGVSSEEDSRVLSIVEAFCSRGVVGATPVVGGLMQQQRGGTQGDALSLPPPPRVPNSNARSNNNVKNKNVGVNANNVISYNSFNQVSMVGTTVGSQHQQQQATKSLPLLVSGLRDDMTVLHDRMDRLARQLEEESSSRLHVVKFMEKLQQQSGGGGNNSSGGCSNNNNNA